MPGGWLMVEDFDSSLPLCLDPITEEEQTFIRVGHALVRRCIAEEPTSPIPARCRIAFGTSV